MHHVSGPGQLDDDAKAQDADRRHSRPDPRCKPKVRVVYLNNWGEPMLNKQLVDIIATGYFPRDTGHEVANERFSFVHLDMDYYDGTLAALEFFWPRMVKGGVILTHDYGSFPAPTKAFDEFFRSRSEPVIELSGIQALAMKAD